MSKFVGGFAPINEEGFGWQTVGELKKVLEEYPEELKLCFVQSTGPAKTETVKMDGEESEETFAPFDFEIEDGVLYIPIYDGKILSLVQNAEKKNEEKIC